MSVKNDGNNIVLINKVNTSPALLDYKYSIYSIFFTFACKESSYSFGTRSVILHIWLLSMSTLIELAVYALLVILLLVVENITTSVHCREVFHTRTVKKFKAHILVVLLFSCYSSS